ncbi:MAG: hypothetical protein ACKOC6_07990, partial [bacterium]
MDSVGRNTPRKEGPARGTGAARYVDDLRFPGMRHGRTIRSRIARGRVTGVTLDFDTTGFTVVDHRDIPGRNVIALLAPDQPCLVVEQVHHREEPILLLAHEDRDTLARARVSIAYESAEPVYDRVEDMTATTKRHPSIVRHRTGVTRDG